MPPFLRAAVLLALAFVVPLAAEQDNSTGEPFWLRRTVGRSRGCRHRPWVCFDHAHPFRRSLCCQNKCVDVGFNESHCGVCGVRCAFGWSCCMGICVNTKENRFHCGNCFTRCSLFVKCTFGICGYDLNLTSNGLA